MSLVVPNGRFHQGHQVWGEPGKSCVVSRLYSVAFPDLSSSDDRAYEDLEAVLRLMLAATPPKERLQVELYTGSVYATALDRFEQGTLSHAPEFSRKVRRELVRHFRKRCQKETLIRSRALLALSGKLGTLRVEKRKLRGFDRLFEVVRRSYEQREVFYRAYRKISFTFFYTVRA
jgi:hypothetical protein